MSYNYEELNIDEVRELLREWRENNERRSSEVLELWESVVDENLAKLGNEKHLVLEQVISAALDCHRYEIADECIRTLSAEFPGSSRVLRYQAMRLEACERYEEALELLDKLIKKDETNAAPRKRRVAILKAQGLITEAIKELVDYLKKFMSDVEGWQELSELYLSQQDYSKAIFCCEESLLHQPHSHLLQQRVADVRYTMGGVENLELAKMYYCRALKLNPDNMRALFGLLLTVNALSAHYKSGGSAKRKDAWRLSQWALTNITAKYKAAQGNTDSQIDALQNTLVALAISN